VNLGIQQYHCPKCGSTDIEVICTDNIENKTISMDDISFPQCGITTLELKVNHYKAICKSCEYTREFTN